MRADLLEHSPARILVADMRKRALLLALILVQACAPAAAPETEAPTGRPSSIRPGFDPAEVRRDLEASARARYGDIVVDRALESSAFLFAKHYYGLPPPPVVRPDGSYVYPDPPVAVLVRQDDRWLAARAGGGLVAVASDKAAALDSALRDAAFWREPAYAEPGCTDAGASLLWLKSTDRPTLIRRGACGATALTERLIFLALDS